MVDERDEQYDGQEEGEYHFSDDQVNYEADDDAPKAAKATSSSGASIKEVALAKFTQHRRVIIGAVVFLVLIGVIYKIVMPSSSVPSTEFTQTVTPTAPVVAAKNPSAPVEAPVTQPAPPAAQPATLQAAMTPEVPNQPAQPAVAPTVADQSGGMVPNNMSGAPASGMPPANVAQTPEPNVSPMQQAQAAMPQAGAIPPPFQPQEQPVTDQQSKNLTDRIASLEQQNAAMMNLLQTEYAQKISDYETQNTSSRGKMEELTKRLNRMEATLNQITQILQGGGRQSMVSGPQGAVVGSPPGEAARVMEPKATYSVQAIIPGRAWLKSDSGDTVTVAEGDVLRSYGRITKIDPYDGIVNIDTGNKVITLSYGMSAE